MRVDLIVGKGGPKIIFRGKVAGPAVMKGRDGKHQKGYNLALEKEDFEKTNYLSGYVRGGMLDLRERRRLPIRLAVTYGGIAGPVDTFTRDINEEGVFVVSKEPLREGSKVHLLIKFPDHPDPVSLAGTVSHTVLVEDEDVPGMGIKFDLSPELAGKMNQLVDLVEAEFLSGSLPDECLL